MPGRKTYLPGLRLIFGAAHRYATRYLNQMTDSLDAPQLACLQSTIQALADCIVLLGKTPVEP
jgi:hypothetical protein